MAEVSLGGAEGRNLDSGNEAEATEDAAYCLAHPGLLASHFIQPRAKALSYQPLAKNLVEHLSIKTPHYR